MNTPNIPWAKYVEAVQFKHQVSTRGQRQRTGIPHSTIMNWLSGVPPRPDGVIKFAKGFGEDVEEALRIAGYDPQKILPGVLDYDPRAEFLRELSAEAGPLVAEDAPVGWKLPEAVERVLGHSLFVEGLASLSQELGRPIPVALDQETAEKMTPESAVATLSVLRRQAEEGLF